MYESLSTIALEAESSVGWGGMSGVVAMLVQVRAGLFLAFLTILARQ